MATFRTAGPAAACQDREGVERATNLLATGSALIAAVSGNCVSHRNSGSWAIELALDGNGRTAWSIAGPGNDAFVEFTLAERARI